MRGKEKRTVDENTGWEAFPGGVFVDNNRNPRGLHERVDVFLEEHPVIVDHAKKKGKKLYARTTSHGTEILVATAAIGVSAVLIYEGAKFLKRADKRYPRFPHPLQKRQT